MEMLKKCKKTLCVWRNLIDEKQAFFIEGIVKVSRFCMQTVTYLIIKIDGIGSLQ